MVVVVDDVVFVVVVAVAVIFVVIFVVVFILSALRHLHRSGRDSGCGQCIDFADPATARRRRPGGSHQSGHPLPQVQRVCRSGQVALRKGTHGGSGLHSEGQSGRLPRCCMYTRTRTRTHVRLCDETALEAAKEGYRIVGESPNHCDTIPGRQCMASR